jgi:hypothetical protein
MLVFVWCVRRVEYMTTNWVSILGPAIQKVEKKKTFGRDTRKGKGCTNEISSTCISSRLKAYMKKRKFWEPKK